MKKIGFLSFGHWSDSPQSATRTASDALLQSIDLAVAAEEIGADGAYFRVHHFARQLASPFPLLAAVGARTSRIEIGTGVIDMRYENPLYMVEDAGAADLIAGGRLQLGISRGSPEQVVDGFRYFGYVPAEGTDHADMAREHTRVFLDALGGEGFAQPNPRPMFANPPGLLGLEPHSPGLRERIWWGAGSRATAEWTAEQGLNLMSSTLAHRGHRRPLPPAPGRADPALPRRLDRRRARAYAACLGQPQHLPDRQRPRPRVLRRRDPQRGPGRPPGGRSGPLRQDLRRRARAAGRGPRRGRGRSPPPTPSSSPSPTSSASTTTPTSSTASSATSLPSSAGAEAARRPGDRPPVPRPWFRGLRLAAPAPQPPGPRRPAPCGSGCSAAGSRTTGAHGDALAVGARGGADGQVDAGGVVDPIAAREGQPA